MTNRQPTKRYRGFFADSGRWWDFPLRDDDIIVSAPSKCGTTWMQTIVGMLLLDRIDLGRPMGLVSPWLDMRTRDRDELFTLLAEQTHRRFIKTHTPLDGLPWRASITYLCVVRHPLDAALSNRDHKANMRRDRATELRHAASGVDDLDDQRVGVAEPVDDAAFLPWWIDSEVPPTGTGLTNLREFAHQASTYWSARAEPNVHLFRYEDLLADRDGQMRRVADVLGIAVDEDRWPAYVEAAGLDAMRTRAADLAPDAHLQLWHSSAAFFKAGRTGSWPERMAPSDVDHFERELGELAGEDVRDWVLHRAPTPT